MTDDDYRDDPTQKDALRAFLDACNIPADAETFMDEVIALVIDIAETLGEGLPVDASKLRTTCACHVQSQHHDSTDRIPGGHI